MKKALIALTAATAMMTQAQTHQQQPGAVFASEFATEHNTPPFSLIGNADYEPAISAGIEKARKELAAIASNPEAPTFENTIVALDRAGRDLDRVLNVFFNLLYRTQRGPLEACKDRLRQPRGAHAHSRTEDSPTENLRLVRPLRRRSAG